jgi:hypothetical protein
LDVEIDAVTCVQWRCSQAWTKNSNLEFVFGIECGPDLGIEVRGMVLFTYGVLIGPDGEVKVRVHDESKFDWETEEVDAVRDLDLRALEMVEGKPCLM